MNIKKILIANRGEIAVRVIRACRELDIVSVAVYSDADANALHVQLADEAVHIGASPALESYLSQDKIITAAKSTRADAIHPGYGFLSENHEFARRCLDEGLIFIGPSPESMRLLGNKIESREIMLEADVPVVPGFLITDSADEIIQNAEEIGYPILVKAAAGGGGKGMRVVNEADELPDAIESAMRESKSAFGDDSVFIEKMIQNPRHIEFQILGDTHGNLIHLNERECSIQRRHQKIIEESPSPVMSPSLQERMGQAAIRAARSADYQNAGTVEFIIDENENFYFLEVNARLQVEHPVTEMTTGIDLVHEQIKIASGERLSLEQEDVKQFGHAIEVRIYAEDPDNGFLPSSGKILFTQEPKGPGIRVDSGIFSGYEVTVNYDPILSKLIVHAVDRESAIMRMKTALGDYPVLGVKNTVGFLYDIMDNPAFVKGDISTSFIETQTQYSETQYSKSQYSKTQDPISKNPSPQDKNSLDADIAAVCAELSNGSNGHASKSQDISKAPQNTEVWVWQMIGEWEIGGLE